MNNIKNFIVISLLLLSQICIAQKVETSNLSRQDFKNTSNNTVTVTGYKKNNANYIYSGGDGGFIDVFSLDKKGKLTPVSSHKLSNGKSPARGLIADNINGTDYLFVGNKGANAVEVFQIQSDGSLSSVFYT